MNIYIYGNQGFKKDIHSTLDHANVKFKLDGNSLIKDIDSLSELKEIIQKNPHDIYLIDDEKIIKKNSKIKFLNPKDGIEEEFLLDNGIADLSVNSLKEIPKYILKKYEESKGIDADIQNSIIDIVDEAYEKDNVELDDELSMLLSKEDTNKLPKVEDSLEEFDGLDNLNLDINLDDIDFSNDSEAVDTPLNNEEFEKLMNFTDDVGLSNTSLDYDDNNNLGSLEEIETLEDNDFALDDFNLDDFDELNSVEEIDNLDEEFNFANDEELENKKIEEIQVSEKSEELEELEKIEDNPVEEIEEKLKNYSKGETMSDEFSELDMLSESDLLAALGEMKNDEKPIVNSAPKNVSTTTKESVSIDSSNVNQLSELISKLLQNKTLEITIKIKD